MTSSNPVLSAMASMVPNGPAVGIKILAGTIKAPQPTAQPSESPHTFSGESRFAAALPPEPLFDTDAFIAILLLCYWIRVLQLLHKFSLSRQIPSLKRKKPSRYRRKALFDDFIDGVGNAEKRQLLLDCTDFKGGFGHAVDGGSCRILSDGWRTLLPHLQ